MHLSINTNLTNACNNNNNQMSSRYPPTLYNYMPPDFAAGSAKPTRGQVFHSMESISRPQGTEYSRANT